MIIQPVRSTITRNQRGKSESPPSRPGFLPLLLCMGLLLCLGACRSTSNDEVVVYTSVDQVYSEPVLKAFEAQTGITVLAVYDVEATKTTGLVNRLIAEKDNPQADVFWSGEFAQTLRLEEHGVLAAYTSPAAQDIPAQYRDDTGFWTGITGRARVLLVNTTLLALADYPASLDDFLNPAYPAEQLAIASPLFGTSATHAAALYSAWGAERALQFFTELDQRRVRILDGNSVVRDLVVRGELMFGLTDTDDACNALLNGAPVAILFPDQEQGEDGTLVIPGSVALIAGAPHSTAGQALIDFLVSAQVEKMLIESGWSHIALRADSVNPGCLSTQGLHAMQVSLPDIYASLPRALDELNNLFLR